VTQDTLVRLDGNKAGNGFNVRPHLSDMILVERIDEKSNGLLNVVVPPNLNVVRSVVKLFIIEGYNDNVTSLSVLDNLRSHEGHVQTLVI